MLHSLRLATLLMLLCFCLTRCSHDNPPDPFHVLKGKLVVNEASTHYVIEVLDGTVSPDRVTTTWLNPNTGTYTRMCSQ